MYWIDGAIQENSDLLYQNLSTSFHNSYEPKHRYTCNGVREMNEENEDHLSYELLSWRSSCEPMDALTSYPLSSPLLISHEHANH